MATDRQLHDGEEQGARSNLNLTGKIKDLLVIPNCLPFSILT